MRRIAYIAAIIAALASPVATAWAAGQIRIETDPPGAIISLNGAVQDVSPITVTNVIPGDHLVVARKAGHRDARRTVAVSPDQKAAVELKLEPITGLVIVHAVPPHAEIEIDGAHHGAAPLLLTDIALGKHRVRASAAGYVTREMDLIVDGRIPRKLEIALTSDSARLTIESEPPGAAVTINGIGRGETPCTVERMPTGESEIEVALPAYQPFKQTVKLQAGDSFPIKAILKPIPAKLTVTTTPAGARVYIDDQFRDESPVTLDRIDPGSHRVRVEMPGFDTDTRTVELKQADDRVEEIRLNKNSGLLEIVTEPPGVRVVVDGKERGVTAAGALEGQSEPLAVDFLAAGEHRLQFSRKGYYTSERTVLVEASKSLSIREGMKRRFTPDTIVRTASGSYEGVMSDRRADGSVVLETKPGIFKTFKPGEATAIEPIKP